MKIEHSTIAFSVIIHAAVLINWWPYDKSVVPDLVKKSVQTVVLVASEPRIEASSESEYVNSKQADKKVKPAEQPSFGLGFKLEKREKAVTEVDASKTKTRVKSVQPEAELGVEPVAAVGKKIVSEPVSIDPVVEEIELSMDEEPINQHKNQAVAENLEKSGVDNNGSEVEPLVLSDTDADTQLITAIPADKAGIARKEPVYPKLDPALRERYLAELQALISQAKRYPKRAIRQRQEGIVWIEFKLDRDGFFEDIRLLESSGYSTLDKAAVSTIEKLERFKPLPAHLASNLRSLSLPIQYVIR